MKVIDSNKLNLSTMRMLDNGSTESVQYVKNDKLYKIFYDNFDSEAKERKDKKIDILINKNISGVVLPKEKIMDIERRKLTGYTMDYIKDSIDLSMFLIVNKDIEAYLNIIKKVSIILRNLHKNKIICGDLNFDNVIIDKSNNPYYIDCDSYQVNGIKSDMISLTLYDYIMTTGKKRLKVDKNTDKLTILLNVFRQLTNEDIYQIDAYRYDELSEQIKFLKEIRPLIKKVINYNSKKVPEIPYLDDYITSNNTYTLKRH